MYTYAYGVCMYVYTACVCLCTYVYMLVYRGQKRGLNYFEQMEERVTVLVRSRYVCVYMNVCTCMYAMHM